MRALVIAAVLAVAMPMSAQFLRTGYFMEGSSRMQLNPANLPSRGYLDAPALGALNVGAYTNSLGLQDLINTFDSDGDFYDNPDFYNKLKVANDLGISLSTDIISFGFYRGKNFWSANVGVRFDLEAGIPRNMFDYLRNSPDGDMDNLSSWNNQNYQISNLRLALNSFAEVGVGYARIINDRLTVGGKFNVLLGMGNLDMKINNVQISTTELYDRYGNVDPNANATIDVDASLEANMKGLELTMDGYPIRRCSSQGQQKSFLIALKMAQYAVMRGVSPVRPILLFDDLFDKLDAGRVASLIKMVVEGDFGQIFITDTDEERLRGIVGDITDQGRFYNVKGGVVTERGV